MDFQIITIQPDRHIENQIHFLYHTPKRTPNRPEIFMKILTPETMTQNPSALQKLKTSRKLRNIDN